MAGRNEAVALQSEFMSLAQIASELGVSRYKAHDIVMSSIPYVRCGRLIRVRRSAFEIWAHKLEIKSGNMRRG